MVTCDTCNRTINLKICVRCGEVACHFCRLISDAMGHRSWWEDLDWHQRNMAGPLDDINLMQAVHFMGKEESYTLKDGLGTKVPYNTWCGLYLVGPLETYRTNRLAYVTCEVCKQELQDASPYPEDFLF